MGRTSTGHGYVFEANGAWHARFYIRVKGKLVKKSLRVCTKDTEHPSKESVTDLARNVVEQALALATDREQIYTKGQCPTCGRYTKKEQAAQGE